MASNKLAKKNDDRMTTKEVAAVTGVSLRTIQNYAKRAGWAQNGVTTLLNAKQVAIIVEAMKVAQPGPNAETLQSTLRGIETTESREVRMAILAQRRIELEQAYNAELEAQLAEVRERQALTEAKAKQLETRLDEAEEWFTIKRVAAINGISWKSLDWRELRAASEFREMPVRKAFDANYGEVNSYHISVFKDCYPELNYEEK